MTMYLWVFIALPFIITAPIPKYHPYLFLELLISLSERIFFQFVLKIINQPNRKKAEKTFPVIIIIIIVIIRFTLLTKDSKYQSKFIACISFFGAGWLGLAYV